MSVVSRQGVKYSLIGYFGFLLGTLSTLFVFPYDMEFYGRLQYILPTAELLLPIVVFGLSFSQVKFFLQSKKVGKHQNFFSVSLLAVSLNYLLFLVGFFLFFYLFPDLKSSELYQGRKLVLPLVLLLALSTVFNKYISNYKRIVVPNIFENLFPKLANLGAFLLFVFIGWSSQAAGAFFLGMFVLSFLGYFFYANKLEKINFDFSLDYLKQDGLYKNVFSYSLFGFLGNIGNYIAFRVDKFMIGEALSFQENGAYSIILGVLSFIMIPQMGLFNISAPLINSHLEQGNFKQLDEFHKKTSLTLYFLGAVLFSCILVGFPYLTNFIRNGEVLLEASPVIWILGSAMIFDLATGFNGHIISLSKYYRFNIVVMLFLAALTIGLNYLFLSYTNLGIIGIALATTISLTVFNGIKLAFNYWKFRVFPITIEMVYTSILCTLGITLALILPEHKLPLVNLVYKPLIVLLIIGVGNYFMNIFPLAPYLNKTFFKSLFKF